MGADSLQLVLLDGFEARVGSVPVVISGARSRQVLAYLALHEGTLISADRLGEALWGDEPPASARNSIQRFVSDLRRDLGVARSRIVSVGGSYRLVLGDEDACDVVVLGRSLPMARSALADGRPGEAISLLESVVAIRSEPLAGLVGGAFVSLEGVRLRELVADCGEVGAEARLAQGDSAGAAADARWLLERYPYRERCCITLATALTRLGRANEALDAVAAFRVQMREDLGLDPSPAVEKVELDILLHRDAAPLGVVQDHAAGAPDLMDSVQAPLYGREALVADVADLLEAKRMVTLTGTGGIGKTVIAWAVIELWRGRHRGVTRFVSFEDVTAQGLVASIGQVVGTSSKAGRDPLGEIVDRIIADVDLLVLDNCEHMTEEIGDFVDELTARSSNVRILATSRRPLGKVFEHLVPIKPLDAELSRNLLQSHLRRTGSDLSDLDADLVVELLDTLDGLPLAIELAAASLRSVGVSDLLARWRADATPPEGGRRERHLSIANAVRSTLIQLTERERELLQICALFPSDFDAAAIDAIAGGPVLSQLEPLTDHSLLEVSRSDTTVRYRMLAPIRAVVRAQSDRLGPEYHQALIAHFERFARDCLTKMKGTESLVGVAELRADLSNIAEAFNLADEAGDVSTMASIVHCLGLANGMSPSVGAKSHLRQWVERLRERTSDRGLTAGVLVKAQIAAAWGLYGSNDGAWYLDWSPESAAEDVEAQAMAAIARFSCGESGEAWQLLCDLDLTTASDSYMRAMLCGVGAVIAYEVGSADGDGLTAAAMAAASESPSHGASFFAGLARSSQALVHGDSALCIEILEATAQAIDGHGLITLENMGLAGVAMTVGLILGEHDPAPLLIGLLDRYLEQHSLDPASVAMALDVAVLQLDRSGRTQEAATLLGLLDRLGLSMAILRGPRAAIEAKIDSNSDWARARTGGSTKTTFEVLRSTRSALAEPVPGGRS